MRRGLGTTTAAADTPLREYMSAAEVLALVRRFYVEHLGRPDRGDGEAEWWAGAVMGAERGGHGQGGHSEESLRRAFHDSVEAQNYRAQQQRQGVTTMQLTDAQILAGPNGADLLSVWRAAGITRNPTQAEIDGIHATGWQWSANPAGNLTAAVAAIKAADNAAAQQAAAAAQALAQQAAALQQAAQQQQAAGNTQAAQQLAQQAQQAAQQAQQVAQTAGAGGGFMATLQQPGPLGLSYLTWGAILVGGYFLTKS